MYRRGPATKIYEPSKGARKLHKEPRHEQKALAGMDYLVLSEHATTGSCLCGKIKKPRRASAGGHGCGTGRGRSTQRKKRRARKEGQAPLRSARRNRVIVNVPPGRRYRELWAPALFLGTPTGEERGWLRAGRPQRGQKLFFSFSSSGAVFLGRSRGAGD